MGPAGDSLLRLLRSLGSAEAQNRLNRISDREIALAMRYLDDRGRDYLLSLLAAPKRARVEEELRLHRRLVIRSDQYQKAIDHLLGLVAEERYGGSLGSYLRPVRPQDGRTRDVRARRPRRPR